MKRIYSKIGDVYSVKISDIRIKYFQYIANDLTQLNSDVIRAFKKIYQTEDNPDLYEIVQGEVEFYAHCIVKLGIRMGFWEKVGNVTELGNTKHILFRDSSDYGNNPPVRVSNDWWVWKINEEQKHVGKLEGENRKAEIGLVMNPNDIVHRIQTGDYDLKFYPKPS